MEELREARELRDICKLQTRDLLEQWCRGHAQGVFVGDAVLCRVLRNFLMYVDGRDASVAPHLIMRGIWEPWITMAIGKYIRPGMRCIDIGSNVGYYTMLMAALVGQRGHVLAVEPSQAAIDLTWRTLSVNGLLDRVNLMQGGAADEEYWAELVMPPRLHGGAHLRRVAISSNDSDTALRQPRPTLVQCAPLDRAPAVSHYDWDFIKIDVEGMERAVFDGLRGTLARLQHVVIAMEITPFHWPEGCEGFLDALKLQGFSVGMIAEDAHGTIVPLDNYAELPKEEGKWKMLWIQK